jgi:hypothetical protein
VIENKRLRSEKRSLEIDGGGENTNLNVQNAKKARIDSAFGQTRDLLVAIGVESVKQKVIVFSSVGIFLG